MAFFYIDNSILLLILILVLLYLLYKRVICNYKNTNNNKKEPFRSCCWMGCLDNCKKRESKSNIAYNPFMYPDIVTPCYKKNQLGTFPQRVTPSTIQTGY